MLTFEEVRAIRALRPLSDDDLRGLMELGQQAEHPHGAPVFRQGAPCDSALMVLQGKLKLTIQAGDTDQQVGEIWPGELVGEAAFYDVAVPYECGAQAQGDVVVLVVDGARLAQASGTKAVVALENHLIETLARQVKANDLGIRKGWQEIREARTRLASEEKARQEQAEVAAEMREKLAAKRAAARANPAPAPEPTLVDKISSFFFGSRA